MTDREICVEAVRQFGRMSQIIKALEEMGELSQALAKWLNGEPEWDNIIEEIVDVGIMLEQLDYIVRESHMGTVSLDEMKQRKIARLAGMLEYEVD